MPGQIKDFTWGKCEVKVTLGKIIPVAQKYLGSDFQIAPDS
jgi:hypothetical protein